MKIFGKMLLAVVLMQQASSLKAMNQNFWNYSATATEKHHREIKKYAKKMSQYLHTKNLVYTTLEKQTKVPQFLKDFYYNSDKSKRDMSEKNFESIGLSIPTQLVSTILLVVDTISIKRNYVKRLMEEKKDTVNRKNLETIRKNKKLVDIKVTCY